MAERSFGITPAVQLRGGFDLPCRSQPCDLALQARGIHARDARRFPRAINTCHRGLLLGIHLNHPCLRDTAPEQERKLSVGHEMKTTRHKVALFCPRPRAVREAHSRHGLASFRRGDPASSPIGHSTELRTQPQTLQHLSRSRNETYAESGHLPHRRLLSDGDNPGSILLQVCSHGQQQRPRPSHHNALSADVISSADECLQSACTKHTGQRPSWERKKSFSRAGRKNQCFKPKALDRVLCCEPRLERSFGCCRIHHLTPCKQLRARHLERRDSLLAPTVCRGFSCSTPPYLATNAWIVIQHRHLATRGSGSGRRPKPRRPSTDHNNVIPADHRCVSTVMPSLQTIWHVRCCGTPSTLARHSKQIPIPQSAVRCSPLSEIRHGTPTSSSAAISIAPCGNVTGSPFTRTVTVPPTTFTSDMQRLRRTHTTRKERPRIECDPGLGNVVQHKPRRARSIRNPEPLKSHRKQHRIIRGGADQRKLIRRCRAKTRPHTDHRKAGQYRHVLHRTVEHSPEHLRFDAPGRFAVLARRSDQQLPRLARLHIERHRIFAVGMSALEITQFHKLMAQNAGISIRDGQVYLTLMHIDRWTETDICARCDDN